MAVEFGLLIVGAYLLGSVPAAHLAAKRLRGIDIRQHGSGNVGITNLLELTSVRQALPVIIFDAGKGVIMMGVANAVGLSIAQQATVGLAAIIGHNWSVFLRFDGGRGVLTSLGIVLALPWINGLNPWDIFFFGAFFLGFTFLAHNVPLGVVTGIAVLPLTGWGIGRPLPIILCFLSMLLILIVRRLTVRHPVRNISASKRLRLLNRLLYDRDIRDRETWQQLIVECREKQGKD